MAAPPPPATDVYWTFNGAITPDSMQLVNRWVSAAVLPTAPACRVHILMQSLGGSVGDGVWLYSLFRGFPRPLTVYNGGHLGSIAAVAYLGAERRCVSPHATFMFHRTTGPALALTANRLRSVLASVEADDARTESIIQERAAFSPELWDQLRQDLDVMLSATDAVAAGIAHSVEEFRPPSGAPLFTFNQP